MNKEDLKVTLDGLTLEQLIEVLEEEMQILIEENTKLMDKNLQLQDEVNTLWSMMDAMTVAEKESWLKVLDELDTDVAAKALMITKKKADC
tara:strand:- start:365 stop:637 length:273 start_codon:yes stop_codon:yes gene_type:complete